MEGREWERVSGCVLLIIKTAIAQAPGVGSRCGPVINAVMLRNYTNHHNTLPSNHIAMPHVSPVYTPLWRASQPIGIRVESSRQ